MPDGDRSVQAAEDAAPQQRSHLLLPLPGYTSFYQFYAVGSTFLALQSMLYIVSQRTESVGIPTVNGSAFF